jgi:hypothetical protein
MVLGNSGDLELALKLVDESYSSDSSNSKSDSVTVTDRLVL